MKKLTLACAVVALIISSCTKPKTDIVTVTKTDTVTNVITDTLSSHLVGSWGNPDNVSHPVFTLDSLTWNSSLSSRYVASGDTIYSVVSDQNIFADYVYSLSKNADTLTLTTIQWNNTYVFYRLN